MTRSFRPKLMIAAIWLTVFAAPRHASAIPELADMPFCMESDFVEMSGASLVAQMPDVDQVLYDKGPTDSVWQTPMQARVENGVPQIWYLRFDYAEEDDMKRSILCLNEILNGNWTPKEISQTTPPWGSGTNNVVMQRSPYEPTWGDFTPHQIIEDATGGLMNLYWDQPSAQGPAGVMRATAYHSGLSFEKVSGTVITEHNDNFTATRVGSEWRLYQEGLQVWPEKPYPDNLTDWTDPNNPIHYKRVIDLRTSNDTSSWTSLDVDNPTLEPDEIDIADDERTEFYAFKTFPYGDKFGGILWKYYVDPALVDPVTGKGAHSRIFKYEMLFSEDGVEWERNYRDTDIGFFSYADPIEWNSRLDFATQGRPATTEEGDTMLKGWRWDRMVGVEGDGGVVRTAPFYFPPNGIDINADTSTFGASIDVTICDINGTPIVGWNSYHTQNNNQNWEALPWSAGHEPVTMKIELNGAAKVFAIRARPSALGVPEPSTFAMAGTFIACVSLGRRRRDSMPINHLCRRVIGQMRQLLGLCRRKTKSVVVALFTCLIGGIPLHIRSAGTLDALSDAVARFNKRVMREGTAGKGEPPPTEEEVEAAIHGWIREQVAVSDATYAIY